MTLVKLADNSAAYKWLTMKLAYKSKNRNKYTFHAFKPSIISLENNVFKLLISYKEQLTGRKHKITTLRAPTFFLVICMH
jgi:hypothetical protein